MSRPQPIVKDGRFVNPFQERTSFWSVMMGFLRGKNNSGIPGEAELDRTLPVSRPEWGAATSAGVRVTWLGHACVYVEMEGVSILTDPVFSNRCSPVQWAGVKRYRPPPCQIADIPRLDICVISHDHYDHLDRGSVEQLAKRFPEMAWFVPLGTRAWFESVGIAGNVTELGWWDEAKTKSGVRVVAFPSNHWCKRSVSDTNLRLWCSWGVMTSKYKFYFAGDTAACDSVFSEIGRDFGPFDLAAIPIGAYEPREIMKAQHVDPAEALAMHMQLQARRSIGMHWGTFPLTYEHYLEPPARIQELAAAAGLAPDTFFVVGHGKSKVVVEGGDGGAGTEGGAASVLV